MVGSQVSPLVNKLLTNVSNKITPQGFIAESILPVVNVVQSAGLLGRYGGSHLRIETSVTGGKNVYPRVDTRTYATTTYQIIDHGLSDIVTKQDKANVEDPFNAEIDTTEELVLKLMLEKEKGLADSLTDTGVLTNNVTLAGSSRYSDYTNSVPLTDFATARGTIYDAVGMAPNTAIMSWKVKEMLRYHPAMLDNLGYKYDRPNGLTEVELARALDVERVLIGSAVYNSAKQGQADVIAPVWGKHIVFAVTASSAARGQTSLGYRLQQFGEARKVYKYAVNNPPEATEIIVTDSYQQLISTVGAGYLIKNAIA